MRRVGRPGDHRFAVLGGGPGLWALCLLLPLLAGGCAQIRNTAIDALETGLRDVLNTTLQLYFEQWRANL